MQGVFVRLSENNGDVSLLNASNSAHTARQASS
jgi:hypothetical protein